MAQPRQPRSKKIGLALGGGGARGLAHIGVLKVLAREGIPIDLMAGTSMGGLIAAIYGAGLSPEEMEAEALRRSKTREIVKLVDLRPSGRGLVKGGLIYNLLANMLGNEVTFDALRLPIGLVAVDVWTGQEVILREGNVADAVRATISFPGIFIPVELGPYKFVDGGTLNNVPVSAARQLGAQVVLAVDVLPNFRQNQPGQPPVVQPLAPPRLPQAVKDFEHIAMIMVSAMTEYHLQIWKPDLVIRPDLPADMDILMSFDRSAAAIEAGEKAARAALPEIQAILDKVAHRKSKPIHENHSELLDQE